MEASFANNKKIPMTTLADIAEQALATAKPRALYSALFNMANVYNQAAESALSSIGGTGNADFAAPAIMCRSFAIELLLKFFIAVEHPNMEFKELKAAGVYLRGHAYSSLFDRINPQGQQVIADEYSKQAAQPIDVSEFRGLLVSLGDEPFVAWRYIYESDSISHIDCDLFALVTQALGMAAQNIIRTIKSGAV